MPATLEPQTLPEPITLPEPPVQQPESAPSSNAPVGIDALMAQLDEAELSGKTIGETPEKPASAKPEAKAEPAKVEAKVEPKEEGEPDWTKAPPKWHKIYEGHKAKTAETIKGLEAKLKALESKPVEQAGDAKKMEILEKQIAELQGETKTYKQRLAETDFTHTPEHAAFKDRANRIWSKATSFVSQLTVTNADGTTRPATREDFDYIRALPQSKRRAAAIEAFGDNHYDVVGYANAIDDIREENDLAAKAYAETHEKTQVQREMSAKQSQQQFDTHYKQSLEAIQKNEQWGKWFSPNESDPEATKLLTDGFAEIERVMSQMDSMTPDQAAAHAAVFRAKSAAMPRVLLEVNRLTKKLSDVEGELAKYRKSDPGSKPSGGNAAPAANKPKGIDGLMEELDRAITNDR